MGLLSTGGEPIVWGSPPHEDAVKYVHEHGIAQLINLYRKYKCMRGHPFLWGEELEHILVRKESDTGMYKLCLEAHILMDTVREKEPQSLGDWRPEYGSFMVESVPREPYTITLDSLLHCEENILSRYELLNQYCAPQDRVVTLVTFPLMGSGAFTSDKTAKVRGSVADSLFVPDVCINQTHPRFSSLTKNIRLRRGRKVCIQIPIFLDCRTLCQTVDRKHNIDKNPMNDSIDCSTVPPVHVPYSPPTISVEREKILPCLRAWMAGEASCEKEKIKMAASSAAADAPQTTFPAVLVPQEKTQIPVPQEGQPKKRMRPFSTSDDDDTETEQKQSMMMTNNNNSNSSPTLSNLSPDIFQHMFTPATDFYYAQYIPETHEKKRDNVRARYNSCPCPVPAVYHPCVYMDCMAFGMGCSCLQVTMQLCDIVQARHVFDQMLVLCPLLLSLTSATPFQKGLLTDSDVRWLTIAASVDDRQPSEVPRIIKSRYDSASVFISPLLPNLHDYNDTRLEIDAECYERLKKEGMDHRLATHFSHLFIRDPLVIFDQRIQQLDDEKQSDHFENIQSTNWQTVRFKPPPFDTDIGWRVEFRSMEIMPTAFENAAFSTFVILLSRAILKYHALMYIPISRVDVNMGRAHRRNPTQQKYYFRKNIFPQFCTKMRTACEGERGCMYCDCVDNTQHKEHQEEEEGVDNSTTTENDLAVGGVTSPSQPKKRKGETPKKTAEKKEASCCTSAMKKCFSFPELQESGAYEELTLNEIFNGFDRRDPEIQQQKEKQSKCCGSMSSSQHFIGLVPLVRKYIEEEKLAHPRLEQYLSLVSRRASGELLTTAQWLRKIVLQHPTYQKDSRLNEEICRDIIEVADALAKAKQDLRGTNKNEESRSASQWEEGRKDIPFLGAYLPPDLFQI